MKVMGIDPGAKGCWCTIDTDSNTAKFGKLRYSIDGILDTSFLEDCPIYIEKVHAIGHLMSVKSAFSFGVSFGQLLGACSKYSFELVTPQKWQKVCLSGIDCRIKNKLRSVAGFERMFPEFRIKRLNDNATDAFHIAHYGLKMVGIILARPTCLNKDVIMLRSKK